MNRSLLKWIALITMTIDHFAFFLLANNTIIYLVMRIIGRLSFPIFAFMIAEGFLKTKNVFKYFKRLVILGVIFEVMVLLIYQFYDFNMSVIPFLPNRVASMNIMFSLALGLVGLYLITHENRKIRYLVIPAALLSIFLPYGYYGFGMIMIFGLIKDNQVRMSLFVTLSLIYTSLPQIFVDAPFVGGSPWQVFAVLSLPFIFKYNGKKGWDLKWLFYVYYPLHV
ncbi:MAG: TraX family protein, partial [Acholeplasmataceae bacterium]|nr:TraX family protein [Acholeplasmataceae bacterium]